MINIPAQAVRPKIKRPCNSFILFRRDLCKSLSSTSGTIISKEAALRWANVTPEVRAHYNKLAEAERAEHNAKYPGHKYSYKHKVAKKRELSTINWRVPTPPGADRTAYVLPPVDRSYTPPLSPYISPFLSPKQSIGDIADLSCQLLEKRNRANGVMNLDNLLN
jgi:HMG (high mobility group) box